MWPKLSCPSPQVSTEAGHLQGLQLDRLERALAEQQRSADAELDRVQRSTREAAEVAIHTAVEEARAAMRVGSSSLQAGGCPPQRCSLCIMLCRADCQVHAGNLGVHGSQTSAAAAGAGPGDAFVSCVWLLVPGCVCSEMGMTLPQAAVP